MEELAFEVFGVFCHQLPERSWFLGEHQLPLCIRCSAITLGALLGALYLVARRPLPSWRVSLLLTAPMLVELWMVELSLTQTTNELRFWTGLSFGFSGLVSGLSFLASRPGHWSRHPGPSV